MKVTYIHHSGFLVETDSCYYLFDYEKGNLPCMDVSKSIIVLSSHGHHDHYNPEIFSMLKSCGMQTVYAILSDDIEVPELITVLQISSGNEYQLWMNQRLTTFESTDVGVAFLIEDQGEIIYHAGDLNDWVWQEESHFYNEQMTRAYRQQIDLLSKKLGHREIDVAFVVLDPRQESNYDRGMCYFLEHVSAKEVYPMHYWGNSHIVDVFLNEHTEYTSKIKKQN